ncbi:OB-fold nucleic acid binding domain-containing protein [Propioniciclava sinopodophylli]|uniref:OB-fold nucleic acid binding domain-containing protein n=1 Tax=Propioniciclava sinopodophylli TaxID=1837344 RepID=UPI003CD0D8C2
MSWLDRMRGLLRSNDELASADRQKRAAAHGCDTIDACTDRGRVVLRGTIDVLTVRPRQDTPWLEAELSDGTGRVTLIWMGRHEIPGIEAGRELLVRGRISVADGARRVYNPHYELL